MNPNGTDIAGDLRPFLKHLVGITGPLALEWFNRPELEVQRKADRTVVTDVDRRIEAVLRTELAKEFPDHGIIGEEHADTDVDAEFTWVVDPIDGTLSYISACPPIFEPSSPCAKATPPSGAPSTCRPSGSSTSATTPTAWCGERKLAVRETPALSDCLLLTTEFDTPAKHQSGAGWNQLVERVGLMRGWGDCYGYTVSPTAPPTSWRTRS